MEHSLIIHQGQNLDVATDLEMAGEAADAALKHHLLEDYLEKISDETRRRQIADIALFEQYLADVNVKVSDMAYQLHTWKGMSHGLVEGFLRWQLKKGYAIGSVNVRLATIKRYCALAAQAGHIQKEKYTLIQTVHGLRGAEGRNVDEKREIRRIGKKKAESSGISAPYVADIKRMISEVVEKHEDGIASRDFLLFCLFSDLGLRCGEVSKLLISNVDIKAGTIRVYRHKTDKTQTHNLVFDSLRAMRLYLKSGLAKEYVFPGYEGNPLTTRAIQYRIYLFGTLVGIPALSPHDLRHYWATDAFNRGIDLGTIQDAGGWTNPYMALRYREQSKIANKGIDKIC